MKDRAELFSEENKDFAFRGVTVVEVTGTNFAGMIAGALLAELGANVIRVDFDESPKEVTHFGVKVDGYGIPYFVESRNKEIVKFENVEQLRKLMLSADIVIDAMKPGYLDSLGIGYRQISSENPKVIYVAVSPYGHFTEKAREFSNVPDSDLTAQAYNGYPSLIGNPYLTGELSYPLRAGFWVAWTMAGVNAAVGALLALIEREKSGKGQFLDIATHDAIAVTHIFPALVGFLFNKSRTKYGTLDYISYPFGIYPTKDGYIALATPHDPDFRGLLKILGRWDLEPDWRFSIDRISDDIERIKEIETILNNELKKYTTKELIEKAKKATRGGFFGRIKAVRRFMGRPIIVKLITLKEVLEEKHWWIRKSFLKVRVDSREVVIPNVAFKMSETPPRVLKLVKGVVRGDEVGDSGGAGREVSEE